MTNPALADQRRTVADEIFEMSEPPSRVVDFNGYEYDGLDTLTRVVFLANAGDPDGDSMKAGFGVSFAPGSATVIDVHGDLDSSSWFLARSQADPAP